MFRPMCMYMQMKNIDAPLAPLSTLILSSHRHLDLFPSGFGTKILYVRLIYPTCANAPPKLTFLI